jgi:predicted O-methyltransferase YrrM
MLERAKAIGGWMTEPELAFLQALALTLPESATVVEIGSWKGRSTVALCEALQGLGARVYAVDAFSGNPVQKANFDQAALEMFRANTAGFDFLEPVVGDSADVASHFADCSVDFVFVDADHSYKAVSRDLRAWQSKRKPGTLIAGHDWGWIGVKVAVRETFGRVGVFESIWYTHKQPSFHSRGRVEKAVRRATKRLEVPGGPRERRA